MKIKINTNKEISEALKLEMVWQQVIALQRQLEYLYMDKGRVWTNKEMEELYFTLNEFCYNLSDRGEMEWQLNEND